MKLIDRIDIRAAIVAGTAAGVAYLATMEFDNRLTGQKIDDLLILGRPLVEDQAKARQLGTGIHLANAAALGVVYAAVARDRLPGPAWLRGVIFGNIENTTLYPLALLEDAHPAVRAGEVDRYWTLSAYLQSIPRHVAYGAVLGWLYERVRRSR